jgi:hypothetical protein
VIGLLSHDKAKVHKGGMRIGKKPKRHDSIWCPQCKGTNAEIKVTKANRRRRSENREKVSLRRINLECNTFVHGSNARNLPV